MPGLGRGSGQGLNNEKGKGIYSKYMSREYKEAWNKISWDKTGVIMFKNLDDESPESEKSNKL